jgi:hypothetical protein
MVSENVRLPFRGGASLSDTLTVGVNWPVAIGDVPVSKQAGAPAFIGAPAGTVVAIGETETPAGSPEGVQE